MSPHLALAPVLVVLLSSAPASLGGSLDLVELNTVQYNVEILDTPVADLATAEEDKEVRMQTQYPIYPNCNLFSYIVCSGVSNLILYNSMRMSSQRQHRHYSLEHY